MSFFPFGVTRVDFAQVIHVGVNEENMDRVGLGRIGSGLGLVRYWR